MKILLIEDDREAASYLIQALDEAGHVTGLLSLDDVVVRGVPRGDIAAREIVETLHAMYARRPRAA